ncbi:Gustatory receptor [Gryllus bimaculatus]|nr:Gustatory receptor [Gryllus bimaculatus]
MGTFCCQTQATGAGGSRGSRRRRALRAHAALLYLAMLALAAFTAAPRVLSLLRGGLHFYHNIDSYQLLVNMSTAAAVPATHWAAAPRLRALLRRWRRFERQLQRCERPVRGAAQAAEASAAALGRRCAWVLRGLAVYLAAFAAVSSLLVAQRGRYVLWTVWYLPPLVFVNAVNYTSLAALDLHRAACAAAARRLRIALRTRALRAEADGERGEAALTELEDAWRSLAALWRGVGQLLGGRLLLFFGARCMQLVLLLYGLATEPQARFCGFVAQSFLELWIATDLAHHAAASLLNMIETIQYDPPSMSVHGLFTLNRGLFVSLVLTLTTYLIVLIQFKFGVTNIKDEYEGFH